MLLPRGRTPGHFWVLALLLLWATLLFGGFIFGALNGQEIPTPARMGSSFVLVVVGWTWYAFARTSRVGLYGLLIAVGMTFGFVGDLFMAGLVPFSDPILGGMGSFGLGHIAYLAAMIYLGNTCGLASRAVRGAAWLVWLLIGIVSWYLVVYRNASDLVLGWAALGYVLLLASTAGCATGLALQSRAFWPLAVGAALFFISDLTIALGKFAGVHSAAMDAAVWLTYGPAQMLIVGSVASALSLASTRRDSAPDHGREVAAETPEVTPTGASR
jgi:hypothetical protein